MPPTTEHSRSEHDCIDVHAFPDSQTITEFAEADQLLRQSTPSLATKRAGRQMTDTLAGTRMVRKVIYPKS